MVVQSIIYAVLKGKSTALIDNGKVLCGGLSCLESELKDAADDQGLVVDTSKQFLGLHKMPHFIDGKLF
ncbi:MAG TPA: hypothetical protein DCL21_04720 [Alphaproteobacteria bacterium]|nr:hypothetical protein [Alphaproteobacteria bacterium]